MGSFRLDPVSHADDNVLLPVGTAGLTADILLNNARWFTRIRWIAVASLAAFGAAGSLLPPEVLALARLQPPGLWPGAMAGLLVLLNLASILWLRLPSVRTAGSWNGVAANLWFQIVSDLLVLTALVYRVGSTDTVISFAYLFHITLACIFFRRRDSFLVTLLSTLLFAATIVLEACGIVPHRTVLTSGPSGAPDLVTAAIFAVPTIFVWLIVWYLVSAMSAVVRQRDHELDEANKRLKRTDEEINLQMLRVTHDLKAPFTGIESNIQILKHAHWDETPEGVRSIIDKIDARSAALRARIGDILTLGGLRSSQTDEKRTVEPVDVRDLLDHVIQDIHGLTEKKRVTVALGHGNATVPSDPKQLKILFSNLISNAIVYSRDGESVEVGVEDGATQVKVRVADHGIGISEKALPHVFDDFFRAQEAAAFNPNSTGLGLAIVRQIARNLRLAITVESEQGKGTAFEVFIPRE